MTESEAREAREALTRVLVANDAEVIGRLRLSAAEAARVSGVTPRQLIYWTKKGLVRASRDGAEAYNSRRTAAGGSAASRAATESYDIYALEKAIRIRQALAKGFSLEKAAQLVEHDLETLTTEIERLVALDGEGLEGELRRRLERLEGRVAELRHTLPASLTISRLRRAVAVLARFETQGTLQAASASGETAKAVTARLGRAVDELESLVREVESAAG